MKNLGKFTLACALGLFVSACAVQTDRDQSFPEVDSEKKPRAQLEKLQGGNEKLFGDITIGGPKKQEEGLGTGAAVNLFLWRAALETLALGPLESADPFGGVIITDWFTLDEEPGNQFRVTAYILGRSLRTDNIKIAMYVRSTENGQMVTRRAASAAETRLENVILTKARTIRATEYR